MASKDEAGVGERLNYLREQRGVTQRELGKRTGLSYAYISRIENGERRPSIRAIRDMAAALGVSSHYLETGDNHGIWVYVTKDELLEAARNGEDLATQIAVEHGLTP